MPSATIDPPVDSQTIRELQQRNDDFKHARHLAASGAELIDDALCNIDDDHPCQPLTAMLASPYVEGDGDECQFLPTASVKLIVDLIDCSVDPVAALATRLRAMADALDPTGRTVGHGVFRGERF